MLQKKMEVLEKHKKDQLTSIHPSNEKVGSYSHRVDNLPPSARKQMDKGVTPRSD
jgi:hypothetical protein